MACTRITTIITLPDFSSLLTMIDHHWEAGGELNKTEETAGETKKDWEGALKLLSAIGDANALIRDKVREREKKNIERGKAIEGNKGVGLMTLNRHDHSD